MSANATETKSEAASPMTLEKRELTVDMNDDKTGFTVWVKDKQLVRVNFFQYEKSEAILDVHAMYNGYVTFSHNQSSNCGVKP